MLSVARLASVAIRIRTSLPDPGAGLCSRSAGVLSPPELPRRGTASSSSAPRGRLIDVDGNVLLDFSGGIGCLNAGHGAPRVIARVREQLDKLQHACFMVAPYEPYVALARKLCSIVPIRGRQKPALFNSGAEAVENAVKIARSATGRPAVLAFDPGFHGRTLLALSLTSKASPYRHGFGPFAPEVYRLPIPDVLRRPHGTSVDEWVGHAIRELHRCLKSTVDPQSIACAIIEPVMGEGGFIVPPREFLADLASTLQGTRHRPRCRRDTNGLRTHRPDVRLRACRPRAGPRVPGEVAVNGFPLSAVVGRAAIMDAVQPGGVGGTFGGNPVSCAAALGAIETIEQDGLVDRAEAIGTVVARRFEGMVARYPFIAEDARAWRHARARTG